MLDSYMFSTVLQNEAFGKDGKCIPSLFIVTQDGCDVDFKNVDHN